MEWGQLLSLKRLRPSAMARDPFDRRSAFDSDFDRVVFSSSFRRLQDKTQVFPLESHDFVRTRLTHSTEVAAVGRALGISTFFVLKDQQVLVGDWSREWSTIVASACMLHDIGNPPFGHSGENYIAQWFEQKLAAPDEGGRLVRRRNGAPLALEDEQEKTDLLKFEGNAHAFRVATRLQTLGNAFGMNLTCATLAALMKYPCASTQRDKGKTCRKKFGFFKSDTQAYERVREATGLKGAERHPLAYLVEAADDIAYSVVDIEDALKKRIISFELIESYLRTLDAELSEEFLQKHLLDQFERLSGIEPLAQRQQLAFQNFRAYTVGKMIASCVEAFATNFKAIMDGTFEADLITEMRLQPLCRALKTLGRDHVYSTSEVVKVEETGKHVLWGLLDIFYDELRYSRDSRLIKTFLPPTPKNTDDVAVSEEYQLAQRVADYVAGMTDTFAVSLYRRLTGVTAQ